MNNVTADITRIEIPTDDGGITRQLAELDAKLTAWTEAMETACALVGQTACHASADDVTPPTQDVSPSDTAEEPVSRESEDSQVDVQTATPSASSSSPVMAEDAEEIAVASTDEPEFRTDNTLDDRLTEPADHDSDEPDDVREAEAAIGTDAVAAEEEIAPAADVADDEAAIETVNEDAALLASLDAETRKDLKVMQRLSMTPRSVRELLEEYEATKKEAPAAPLEKKSWFFRGRK